MSVLNYKRILGELKRICIGLGVNVYTTDRPRATSEYEDSFIVVSIPVRIYDNVAYGSTYCRFTIFSRDIASIENYEKLTELQEGILSRIPYVSDVCYILNPVCISGGDDDMGFHSLHIQCRMFIK